MAKVQKIDIDNFIADHGVEVVIHGRSYVIHDIPTEVVDALSEVPIDHKKVVAMLLDLEDPSVLDDYGLVALSKIINAVHENLLPGVSPKSR